MCLPGAPHTTAFAAQLRHHGQVVMVVPPPGALVHADVHQLVRRAGSMPSDHPAPKFVRQCPRPGQSTPEIR